MPVAIQTTWAAAWLRHLPAGLLAALDGWSERRARRRALARRQHGARKVSPLPPVLKGHPALPHPWRG